MLPCVPPAGPTLRNTLSCVLSVGPVPRRSRPCTPNPNSLGNGCGRAAPRTALRGWLLMHTLSRAGAQAVWALRTKIRHQPCGAVLGSPGPRTVRLQGRGSRPSSLWGCGFSYTVPQTLRRPVWGGVGPEVSGILLLNLREEPGPTRAGFCKSLSGGLSSPSVYEMTLFGAPHGLA